VSSESPLSLARAVRSRLIVMRLKPNASETDQRRARLLARRRVQFVLGGP